MKERLVILNQCYDADGIKLMSDEDGVMEIKLREPAECKCIKCGNFSRWNLQWNKLQLMQSCDKNNLNWKCGNTCTTAYNKLYS